MSRKSTKSPSERRRFPIGNDPRRTRRRESAYEREVIRENRSAEEQMEVISHRRGDSKREFSRLMLSTAPKVADTQCVANLSTVHRLKGRCPNKATYLVYLQEETLAVCHGHAQHHIKVGTMVEKIPSVKKRRKRHGSSSSTGS